MIFSTCKTRDNQDTESVYVIQTRPHTAVGSNNKNVYFRDRSLVIRKQGQGHVGNGKIPKHPPALTTTETLSDNSSLNIVTPRLTLAVVSSQFYLFKQSRS